MNRKEILQIAKPILFNTDMVRAILDGRKTVTRRVIKPQPEGAHAVLDCDDEEHTFDLLCGKCVYGGMLVDWAETIKAPFWPEDILYVRETFSEYDGGYIYKTHCVAKKMLEEVRNAKISWRPSIHMPKEAARIFLRVTDVRVEKLHDMKTDDFLLEGIPGAEYDIETKNKFVKAWDSTIKKSDIDRYGWDANPWVFVIEFEQVGKR